ncbi:hypothetical protein [Thermobacillus composti]|uniref:hypothetical protein n=1 Tax=Thermobacillus composti TaxID=377615 RepID=UPI002FC2C26A
MVQIRPQNERVAFRHFILPVFLPNIQAALRDDKQIELADRTPLGMLPPRSGQAVARADVVGKRKSGEFDRRHARQPLSDQVEIVIEKVDLLILPCLQTAYNSREQSHVRAFAKSCPPVLSAIFFSSDIIACATDQIQRDRRRPRSTGGSDQKYRRSRAVYQGSSRGWDAAGTPLLSAGTQIELRGDAAIGRKPGCRRMQPGFSRSKPGDRV